VLVIENGMRDEVELKPGSCYRALEILEILSWAGSYVYINHPAQHEAKGPAVTPTNLSKVHGFTRLGMHWHSWLA